MEIETAGNAVDIEKFAAEKQAGDDFAFHGFETHFAQTHAAASDEFVGVKTFTGDGEFHAGELLDEMMARAA